MNINQTFSSPFLKPADIGDDGEQKVLTIEKFDYGQNRDGEVDYLLVFKELPEKKWSLNATNRKTIAKVLGEETDEWAGKQITLYVVDVQNPSGELVPGIRVRMPKKGKPATGTAPTPKKPGDDIPFDLAPAIAGQAVAVNQLRSGSTVMADANRLGGDLLMLT